MLNNITNIVMSEVKAHKLSSSEYAIAGALSGFLTRFFCQPLDVLKILFQLQVDTKYSPKYTNIFQCASLIVKEEGVTALWKGHVPAQCLSIAFGAVHFSCYKQFLHFTQQFQINNKFYSDNALHFYAGAVAGVTAVLCSFPFDLIRTRLIAQSKSENYSGMFSTTKTIWKQEGIKGYFRGIIPACAQTAPASALIFGFKNLYTHIWAIVFNEPGEIIDISVKGHLITGLLSGITGKILIYPLDVVKKRLQIQGMDERKNFILKKFPYCRNFGHCIFLVWQHEGFFGLFKGIQPALLKAGLSNSINFTIFYELCKFLELTKR